VGETPKINLILSII